MHTCTLLLAGSIEGRLYFMRDPKFNFRNVEIEELMRLLGMKIWIPMRGLLGRQT